MRKERCLHSDDPQPMMTFNMEPHTRRQLDTVLGWIGYSLSYTEQDSTALAGAPMLGDVRASRATVAPRTAVTVSSRERAASTLDRKPAAMQMLEAFAEGLQVCARLTARFVRAGYLYISQRVREYRDRDEAIQSASDHIVRPTVRERLDESLERVLDVLETRAVALSPMPAFRRARAAFIARANERVDRIAEQTSQLATKLSPTRAFRSGREALGARVSATTDGVRKRADQVADGIWGLVSRNRDVSVDPDSAVDEAPFARVRWPEHDQDQDHGHDHGQDEDKAHEHDRETAIAITEPESALEAETDSQETTPPLTPTAQIEPEPSLHGVTPSIRETQSFEAPKMAELPAAVPSLPTDLVVQDKQDEDVSQSIDDGEQDRPSFFAFLRWSSLLEFLRPRERSVPSLFVDSMDPKASFEVVTEVETEVGTEDPTAEAPAADDGSVWPERSVLERLEIMLSLNADLTAAPGMPKDSEGREHRRER